MGDIMKWKRLICANQNVYIGITKWRFCWCFHIPAFSAVHTQKRFDNRWWVWREQKFVFINYLLIFKTFSSAAFKKKYFVRCQSEQFNGFSRDFKCDRFMIVIFACITSQIYCPMTSVINKNLFSLLYS